MEEMQMEGYWWQCGCGHKTKDLSSYKGGAIPGYIRDEVINSGWNQGSLSQDCPKCHAANSMRITYEFPGSEVGTVQVIHMVGLDSGDGDYVPMFWETAPVKNPTEPMFQFNYIRGKNATGFNRAAILSLADIRELLELYEQKTGNRLLYRFGPPPPRPGPTPSQVL